MSAADMAADTSAEMTDGFHLVVDALKLNGVDTIFGWPASRSPTQPPFGLGY